MLAAQTAPPPAQYPPMRPPEYTPMMPVVSAPPPPVMQQQSAVSQQTVVVNQAGSQGLAGIKDRIFVDPEGVRGWSSGLCGCCNDLTSCLCAAVFIPCMMCRVANRMKECAFVWCLTPFGLVPMRVKLRTMGGIHGSICQDFLTVSCCPCCVVCQMSRELDGMGL